MCIFVKGSMLRKKWLSKATDFFFDRISKLTTITHYYYSVFFSLFCVMLTNLYVLIIIILIVQTVLCRNLNQPSNFKGNEELRRGSGVRFDGKRSLSTKGGFGNGGVQAVDSKCFGVAFLNKGRLFLESGEQKSSELAPFNAGNSGSGEVNSRQARRSVETNEGNSESKFTSSIGNSDNEVNSNQARLSLESNRISKGELISSIRSSDINTPVKLNEAAASNKLAAFSNNDLVASNDFQLVDYKPRSKRSLKEVGSLKNGDRIMENGKVNLFEPNLKHTDVKTSKDSGGALKSLTSSDDKLETDSSGKGERSLSTELFGHADVKFKTEDTPLEKTGKEVKTSKDKENIEGTLSNESGLKENVESKLNNEGGLKENAESKLNNENGLKENSESKLYNEGGVKENAEVLLKSGEKNAVKLKNENEGKLSGSGFTLGGVKDQVSLRDSPGRIEVKVRNEGTTDKSDVSFKITSPAKITNEFASTDSTNEDQSLNRNEVGLTSEDQPVRGNEVRLNEGSSDIGLSSEETVSKRSEAKLREEHSSNGIEVKLTSDGPTLERYEVKVSNEDQFPKENHLKLNNDPLLKRNEVKLPSEDQLSKTNEVKLTNEDQFSKGNEVKLPSEDQYSKSNEVKLSEDPISEITEVKLPIEDHFTKGNEVKLMGEEKYSKRNEVRLPGEEQFSKRNEVKLPIEDQSNTNEVKIQIEDQLSKRNEIKSPSEDQFSKRNEVKLTSEDQILKGSEATLNEGPSSVKTNPRNEVKSQKGGRSLLKTKSSAEGVKLVGVSTPYERSEIPSKNEEQPFDVYAEQIQDNFDNDYGAFEAKEKSMKNYKAEQRALAGDGAPNEVKLGGNAEDKLGGSAEDTSKGVKNDYRSLSKLPKNEKPSQNKKASNEVNTVAKLRHEDKSSVAKTAHVDKSGIIKLTNEDKMITGEEKNGFVKLIPEDKQSGVEKLTNEEKGGVARLTTEEKHGVAKLTNEGEIVKLTNEEKGGLAKLINEEQGAIAKATNDERGGIAKQINGGLAKLTGEVTNEMSKLTNEGKSGDVKLTNEDNNHISNLTNEDIAKLANQDKSIVSISEENKPFVKRTNQEKQPCQGNSVVIIPKPDKSFKKAPNEDETIVAYEDKSFARRTSEDAAIVKQNEDSNKAEIDDKTFSKAKNEDNSAENDDKLANEDRNNAKLANEDKTIAKSANGDNTIAKLTNEDKTIAKSTKDDNAIAKLASEHKTIGNSGNEDRTIAKPTNEDTTKADNTLAKLTNDQLKEQSDYKTIAKLANEDNAIGNLQHEDRAIAKLANEDKTTATLTNEDKAIAQIKNGDRTVAKLANGADNTVAKLTNEDKTIAKLAREENTSAKQANEVSAFVKPPNEDKTNKLGNNIAKRKNEDISLTPKEDNKLITGDNKLFGIVDVKLSEFASKLTNDAQSSLPIEKNVAKLTGEVSIGNSLTSLRSGNSMEDVLSNEHIFGNNVAKRTSNQDLSVRKEDSNKLTPKDAFSSEEAKPASLNDAGQIVKAAVDEMPKLKNGEDSVANFSEEDGDSGLGKGVEILGVSKIEEEEGNLRKKKRSLPRSFLIANTMGGELPRRKKRENTDLKNVKGINELSEEAKRSNSAGLKSASGINEPFGNVERSIAEGKGTVEPSENTKRSINEGLKSMSGINEPSETVQYSIAGGIKEPSDNVKRLIADGLKSPSGLFVASENGQRSIKNDFTGTSGINELSENAKRSIEDLKSASGINELSDNAKRSIEDLKSASGNELSDNAKRPIEDLKSASGINELSENAKRSIEDLKSASGLNALSANSKRSITEDLELLHGIKRSNEEELKSGALENIESSRNKRSMKHLKSEWFGSGAKKPTAMNEEDEYFVKTPYVKAEEKEVKYANKGDKAFKNHKGEDKASLFTNKAKVVAQITEISDDQPLEKDEQKPAVPKCKGSKRSLQDKQGDSFSDINDDNQPMLENNEATYEVQHPLLKHEDKNAKGSKRSLRRNRDESRLEEAGEDVASLSESVGNDQTAGNDGIARGDRGFSLGDEASAYFVKPENNDVLRSFDKRALLKKKKASKNKLQNADDVSNAEQVSGNENANDLTMLQKANEDDKQSESKREDYKDIKARLKGAEKTLETANKMFEHMIKNEDDKVDEKRSLGAGEVFNVKFVDKKFEGGEEGGGKVRGDYEDAREVFKKETKRSAAKNQFNYKSRYTDNYLTNSLGNDVMVFDDDLKTNDKDFEDNSKDKRSLITNERYNNNAERKELLDGHLLSEERSKAAFNDLKKPNDEPLSETDIKEQYFDSVKMNSDANTINEDALNKNVKRFILTTNKHPESKLITQHFNDRDFKRSLLDHYKRSLLHDNDASKLKNSKGYFNNAYTKRTDEYGFIRRPSGDGDSKRSLLKNDERYFENVVEAVSSVAPPSRKSTASAAAAEKRAPKSEKNYREIKVLLGKLLEEISDMEKRKREDVKVSTRREVESTSEHPATKPTCSNKKKKKEKDENRKTRWGHWTDWSSCSVSCGKGRQIRWRHCIEHCEEAETEMEEKTCQLPACGPGKLFGVIKLP